MYIDFEDTGYLLDELAALPRSQDQHIMLHLADTHQGQLKEIVDACSASHLPVFGGVFPGLLAQGKVRDTGAIARVFSLTGEPMIVDLSGGDIDWSEHCADVDLDQARSGLMFFDCLAPDTGGFIHSVFDYFGNQGSYIGAGAGNRKVTSQPCLFAGGEIYQNAGLLAFTSRFSSISVGHGWRRFKGPFLASRCEGNHVIELDWQPAEKVYLEALPESHRVVDDEQVFARVTADFPLGIYMEGQEDIVRDPIGHDETSLIFVSEIPENSQVYMMCSDVDGLLTAARKVAEQSDVPNEKSADYLFTCDCFTRTLFLGDHFQDELDIIWNSQGEKVQIEGVVALGEIAGDGESALQIHNKTMVTGLMYD